jgi:hypothetical protein
MSGATCGECNKMFTRISLSLTRATLALPSTTLLSRTRRRRLSWCAAERPGHETAFSRRNSRPSFASRCPSESEGAGNAGCAVAPIASHAKMKKHTSVVTTGTPVHAGIPRAMVLTGSFALSPVSMTSESPSPADCSVSGPPGPTSRLSRLGTSQGVSGPHDFAVRVASFIRARMRA